MLPYQFQLQVTISQSRIYFVTFSFPSYLVSEITLAISRNYDRKKSQKVLTDYIRKRICTAEKIENEVDLKLWPQDMINAFCQYCIIDNVIWTMSLNEMKQSIELTGRTNDVDEALKKFQRMTKILKEKVIENKKLNGAQNEYVNIWLNYCDLDRDICSRLEERLIGEGYLVSHTKKKCDLIIIYLSEEFATKNLNEIKDAKSSKKTILVVKPTKLACRGKNNWLNSMVVMQHSCELFPENFTIELDDKNFNREYDRLLIEVVSINVECYFIESWFSFFL